MLLLLVLVLETVLRGLLTIPVAGTDFVPVLGPPFCTIFGYLGGYSEGISGWDLIAVGGPVGKRLYIVHIAKKVILWVGLALST